MIVNLNLHNKLIVVVGAGAEAQKRINILLKQGCRIMVISDSVNSHITKLAKAKKIRLKRQKIQDTKFISKLKPYIIITTTSDRILNQKIINDAKKSKIIIYSSDNPKDSDFTNPAIIDFKDIKVAIFTGSPAMSKKIRIQTEKILKETITKQDIARIKIQKIARELAKGNIPTQIQRKKYLEEIMADTKIDQLIKDSQMNKAEKRANTLLRNWK